MQGDQKGAIELITYINLYHTNDYINLTNYLHLFEINYLLLFEITFIFIYFHLFEIIFIFTVIL